MITVDHLTRRYGDFTAVNDISFECRPGTITGFLGPNGAGKSTAMRAMVALTPPTAGRVSFNGRPYAEIPNPGREVGVLLDASAQHPGRSGKEILTLGAIAMGLPRSRVDQMLEQVSLDRREASRRLRNYSLGMKQRLGIAHALLGDPKVLILDEPANGLDPAGIRWMRDLLRVFAERGGTVLLSSHLLHEVEQIADEMILIGHGSIIARGDLANLMALAGPAGSVVNSADDSRLSQALVAAGFHVGRDNNGLTVDAPCAAVGEIALAAGVALTELRRGGGGLEDLFLELTASTQREGNIHV